ncbi:MAG TPA: ABC transporter substrate-binding protein [Pelomicrobium sp.]|nr:ABC transporter substrate-binding protein [Pelomicrobium sp.]
MSLTPSPHARLRTTCRTGATTLLVAFALVAAAGAAPLTAEEEAGKTVYTTGTSPSGGDITAYVGLNSTRVPGSVVPCANCHGPDGLGRAEGGVVPPPITWPELAKPYGHVHDNGRRHGPFDEKSFARAVQSGVDPAGNRLDPAMPRYVISNADLRSLAAYLKRIAGDLSPGVREDAVTIATLLPESGPLGEAGRAMRRVLEAQFAEINAAGGVYGRRIELDVRDSGDSAKAALAAARTVFAQDTAFAIVSPMAVGMEANLTTLAEEAQVPVVGPFTLAGPGGGLLNRYTFFLLGGLEEQARVLAEYAVREKAVGTNPTAAVYPADETHERVARALAAQLARHGAPAPAASAYPPNRLDAVATAHALKGQAPAIVFFLGSDPDLAAFLTAADRLGWHPTVAVLGSQASRAAAAAPAAFDGRILLAYPTLPGPVDAEGARAFEELGRRHALAAAPAAPQRSAYAAGRLLAEGLRRAGRQLTRERLVAALEGLHEYRTGVLPPLGYNADRRVGALGGYVVALDTRERTFRVVSGWVRID